ncbi:MAG: metalloregulator ArsR/SmtB family transcription factor [Verrucomicrobiota bacterium]
MITSAAISAFDALAHDHRLRVFRMLIRTGPTGMSAGDIARNLEIPPSSLSFHLGLLERAGLIESRRDRRRIFYSAHVDGIRQLINFLTEDCCNGRPELCGAVFGSLDTQTR